MLSLLARPFRRPLLPAVALALGLTLAAAGGMASTAAHAQDNQTGTTQRFCLADTGQVVADGVEVTQRDGKLYRCDDGTLVLVEARVGRGVGRFIKRAAPIVGSIAR
jgi:hypothetical protein